MHRISQVLVMLLAIMLGCSSDVPPAQWQLIDGREVGWIGSYGSSVILIYDPADCFVCDNVLPRWLMIKSTNDDYVHLFFTRMPTREESRQLELLRVRPDGILKKRFTSQLAGTPAEYLIVSGEVVHAERIKPRQVTTLLLEHLSMRADIGTALASFRPSSITSTIPLQGANYD